MTCMIQQLIKDLVSNSIMLMETEDGNDRKKGGREGREEQPALSDPNILCVRTVQSTFIDVTLDHCNKP